MWKIFFILAVIFSAATDEIDHKKAAQILYDLWHLSRDITFVMILLTGYYWHHFIWLEFWGAILIGAILWEAVYRFAFKIKLHELDNKIDFGLPFEIFGFGKRSGQTFWQWFKNLWRM